MSTHKFPAFVQGHGKNSVVQWSNDPDGSLIVFVHGFGGDAIATWNDFQGMLPADPRAAHTDLIYYGYESTRGRAVVHADAFLEFLEWVIAQRRDLRRIVIVAHSLGAMIIRRAIIVAFTDHRPWINQTRIVLFGPAHRGASIQALAAQTAGMGLLSTLYVLALYKVPVLQDLHPDSKFLEELRDEYDKHMPRPGAPPLMARVVFGEDDSVVEILDFLPRERPDRSWPGHDHFSVCKPNTGFRKPIDTVMEALS